MNELEVKRTPELIGAEIRMYVDAGRRITLLCGIEIGRRLKEAKELLAHGEWLPWLEKETDFSDRTAQRYMRVFEEYGAAQLGLFGPETNATTLSDLPISKALALLSVPESEREAFAVDVDAEHLSTRELEQAIRERDEARKQLQDTSARLEDTQRSLSLAQEAEGELTRKLSEAKKDVLAADRMAEENERELKERIRELESRPVEVAVERDEAAIQEAARLARAKAEADAAERETALQKQLDAALKKAEKAEKAAEKAKAEAEKSGESGKAELAKAAQDAAQARKEAEELRKQLKLADPSAAKISLLFEQIQEAWGTAMGIIDGISDTEKAGKLRRAAGALLQLLGEDVAEKETDCHTSVRTGSQ